MSEFLARLRQRKLVQWALAYIAFWFAFLQGIDIVAARFDWPSAIERYFILVLAIGFFVVLVLAWYHRTNRSPLGAADHPQPGGPGLCSPCDACLVTRIS